MHACLAARAEKKRGRVAGEEREQGVCQQRGEACVEADDAVDIGRCVFVEREERELHVRSANIVDKDCQGAGQVCLEVLAETVYRGLHRLGVASIGDQLAESSAWELLGESFNLVAKFCRVASVQNDVEAASGQLVSESQAYATRSPLL